jgi:hypothetical protein
MDDAALMNNHESICKATSDVLKYIYFCTSNATYITLNTGRIPFLCS